MSNRCKKGEVGNETLRFQEAQKKFMSFLKMVNESPHGSRLRHIILTLPMIFMIETKSFEGHWRWKSLSFTFIPGHPSKKRLASIRRAGIPSTREVRILTSSLNGLIQRGELDAISFMRAIHFGWENRGRGARAIQSKPDPIFPDPATLCHARLASQGNSRWIRKE